MSRHWAVVGTVGILLFATGADWPAWRGPARDGICHEANLLKSWPQDGPPLRWTCTTAGAGYSGPAVVGNRLYLTGARGDAEFLFALDTATGKELWSTKIGAVFTFKGNQWGDGPRATAAVDGGLVYALGGLGDLLCADADSGKERWRVSLLKDLHGEISPAGGNDWGTGWGYTGSPLIDAERLVCVPGGRDGTLAALDKQTGKVLWRSKELSEPATYGAPIVADVNGVRQYIQILDKGAAGVAAADGRLLWVYEKKPPYTDVVIPTPLYHDGQVYLTAGYGAGCDLVRLTKTGDRFKAQKVSANKNMTNAIGGVVLVDGHVYGYSEGKGWICQDWKTGKLVWSERRKLGRGSILAADDRLVCYDEADGKAVLIEASAAGWKEHGRFEIPQHAKARASGAKIWTPPVIANGRLYLRDQELLFCFDVSGGNRQ
jgi:outer membrane protein assembly factor BamB